MIYDIRSALDTELELINPSDKNSRRYFNHETKHENLLVEIVRQGDVVYEFPNLQLIRQTVKREFARMNTNIRSLEYAQNFPVCLEQTLFNLRQDLVKGSLRKKSSNRDKL